MGNRVAFTEKVFGNCGFGVTTAGVKYRASMFIKTVLEAAFGFPNLLQITKAALNHVNNIESITSNVRFEFVSFTRRVESIIVTSMVNIGACGAVPAVAPKRTRSGQGIVTILSVAIGL